MVIHRYKAYIEKWKYTLNIASCFHIISTQSGKILYDHAVNHPVLDVLHHLVKSLTFKVRTGFGYIEVFFFNHYIILVFHKTMEKSHLCFDSVSLSVFVTLKRKSRIKSCMGYIHNSNFLCLCSKKFTSHIYKIDLS